MRELQALCLDIAVYKVGSNQDTKLDDNEINLMEELYDDVNQQLITSTVNNNDISVAEKFFIGEWKS